MNDYYPLLRFYNPMKTFIFDVYFPDHLNLDSNNKEDWKIYADRIRNIISKVLNLEKSYSGKN